MDFRAGKGGTAVINGTELPVTDWSVDPSVDVVRFRNSKTNEFSEKATTYKEASFSISVDYDFDANPFAVAPGLTIGAVITNVKLHLGTTTAPFWSFPSAIIVSTPQRLSNEGRIETSFNCENDGTFSPPA